MQWYVRMTLGKRQPREHNIKYNVTHIMNVMGKELHYIPNLVECKGDGGEKYNFKFARLMPTLQSRPTGNTTDELLYFNRS